MKIRLEEAERLLAGLQHPSAYPHPVDSIRVAETHISWVLLTGQFAYKLKKLVKLGFLDFSTLEQRRRFCEEELRLNRRFSPDLYLAVVPITGTFAEPRVGGKGEPIEYAVQMRQFPDDALLSHRLRANRVTPAHVDALARTIAEFHAGAAIATTDSPWGTPDSVRDPVDENFAQLRLVGIDSPEVQKLHDWSQAEFHRLRPEFEARRNAGFVRECHGDLHANNVLILGERVQLFDCVEFNESFRWVDVFSDLAFLAMDLADFDRTEFANRLLNAYLEITGDYAGLAVWRYYLVYRAMVRAKVAAIRSRQETPDSGAAAAKDELSKYLTLAERITHPAAPQLFITHGPSGSGKSTFTQPLLESLGAIRIRSDVERRRESGSPLDERYSADARQRVYDQLARCAELILRSGMSAIIDATFLKRFQRTQFRDLAKRLDVPMVVLDFQTPPDVLHERINQRQQTGHDPSEANTSVLEAQLQSAEPLEANEHLAFIAIDTTKSAQFADVARRLQDTF